MKRIENKANDLLSTYCDADIVEIVKSEGIEIVSNDIESMLGLWAVKKGKEYISVNKDLSPFKERFVLAALLGASILRKDKESLFLLEKGVSKVDCNKELFFARAILLPESIIKQKVTKDFELGRLANELNVEPHILAIRLFELGYAVK